MLAQPGSGVVLVADRVDAQLLDEGLATEKEGCILLAEDLEAAVGAARLFEFGGFNCTIPHKIAVIPLLDGLEPSAEISGACNTVVRQADGRKLLFVINHTEETQTVSVPAGKERLLGGGTTGETLDLEAYGVAVIRL